tara:strand:- start:3863 stop:5833 length:1971 start_codon:yes stop_codon:yes gene_type:complete
MVPRRNFLKRRRFDSNIKVIGFLKKSRGNRFKVIDDQSETHFKVSNKELKKAFVGDKVQCGITRSGWAVIEKVIERNTNHFVGTVTKYGKNFKAFPLETGKFNPVLIQGDVPKKLKINSLVKVKLTQQPNINLQPMGRIELIFNESDIETKANEIAISKFNLRTEWPKGVINEVRKLNKTNLNKRKRKNLTNLPFVTIDGKKAKDFDDAVFAEKDNKGGFNLYVAIADVANYVKTRSFIDEEAKARGTSIYFSNKVLPMLPEELSNKLCSLKPNEERWCLICKIKLNKFGIPCKTLFFEGIIKSEARLTYEETSKYFESGDYPDKIGSSLKCLKELFELLKKQRNDRGALDLLVPEYEPRFVRGKVDRFFKTDRKLAHRVIEECMLLANISAAQILYESNFPSIYRIHPKPDFQGIKQLEAFARTRNINIKMNDEGDIKDFYQLSQAALERRDKEIIHMQILQSLKVATYSEKLSGHFALAYGAYTHFTSPIRRYPDLMVHRILKELIKESPNNEISVGEVSLTKLNSKNYPFNSKATEKIAYESSLKERLAEKASRDAKKTIKCELASERINEFFKGYISEITNFGIFVHLTELGIEGLCHIKNLPGDNYYLFDETSKSLVGRTSGHGYFLGNSISVRIKSVDIPAQRIDLEITK